MKFDAQVVGIWAGRRSFDGMCPLPKVVPVCLTATFKFALFECKKGLSCKIIHLYIYLVLYELM